MLALARLLAMARLLERQRQVAPGGAPLSTSDLGTIAVQLAGHFSVWVHRRRFTFSYVNDTTIRQRMSVDFILPPSGWFWTAAPPATGSTIFVPLHIIRKDPPLTAFNVEDEEGRRLPLLTIEEATRLTVDGLADQVQALAHKEGIHDERLLAQLRCDVKAIVEAPRTERSDPVTEVFEQKVRGAAMNRALALDAATKSLLRDVADGILTLVPITYEPGGHHLLKLQWDGPNYWHGRKGDAWGSRRWNALASISWANKRQAIPHVQIGWARTTHVELTAPPEVQLTAAGLHLNKYDPSTRKVEQTPLKMTPHDRQRPNRVRLNLQTRPLAQGDPRGEAYRDFLAARGDTADVVVSLRTPSSGVFLAATLASAFTSVLLWFVAAHLTELDGETSSSVLLILPALAAAYLARPGEHPFATRLLTGVRMCALVVGVCSLLVAAGIGLGMTTRPVDAQSANTRPAASAGERCPRQTETDCVVKRAGAQGAIRLIAGLASVLTAVLGVGLLFRRWLPTVLKRLRLVP